MSTETETLLNRIANALERIAPPDTDPGASVFDNSAWTGTSLMPILNFAPVDIDLLTGIDEQKLAVLENCRRLASGSSAHDILLWGARGSGKSALVKSAIAAVRSEGRALKLVETTTEAIATLPALLQQLSHHSDPTILFIDDLGFTANDDTARHLRSVLDGGVMARPPHVRLYATSNRRHILPRDLAEQASAINPRDVVDDQLALSDRFGLSLGFHVCDQANYLAMVSAYAKAFDLAFDPHDALLWSTQRGARSGRIAWHYMVELVGRAGKKI